MNKIFRIIFLYSIGFTSLIGFYLVDKYILILDFVKKAEKIRPDAAFGSLVFYGFLKYGLLVVGVGIITILTVQLTGEMLKARM